MDNVIYSVLHAYLPCKIDAVLQFLKQVCVALLPTDLRDMAPSRSDILNVSLPLLFYFRPNKNYKFNYKEYFTPLTSSTVNDLRMTDKVVTWYFCVLLTVHLGMILVNNQIDAQFFVYVYFYSLNVSGNHVPIIRRVNCMNTCIPDGHLHSDINQVSHWYNNSPDDGHMAARNM